MPSDLALKAVNVVHRALIRATGGRVGGRAKNMPVLELVTTGRKSGARRSVLLTSPLQEGEAYVVVASRGGDDHHPAWYLNVVAEPKVDVVIGGRSRPMQATVPADEERVRLWAAVTALHPHYAGYQRKTEREIPLVRLAPR